MNRQYRLLLILQILNGLFKMICTDSERILDKTKQRVSHLLKELDKAI